MGYAIMHNDFIEKDNNIQHIYEAEIISNSEDRITIRIGKNSLCQEITIAKNLREHLLFRNSISLIASDIGVNENYSWYLDTCNFLEKDKYRGETTIIEYMGYAEEKDIIILSAFIGETVCPDCLSYFYKNILKKDKEHDK